MNRRIRFFVAVSLTALLCALACAWPCAAMAEGDDPPVITGPGETGAPGERLNEVLTADTLTDDKTCEGDTLVSAGAVVNINGHNLTINGNLTILGTLNVGGGTLTVNGNVDIEGGILQMTETNGSATVTGSFSTSGADHSGKLTAGTMKLGGNFMQYAANSPKAFCPSGAFKMELTNSTSTIVYFETPAGSWLYGLTPITKYSPDSNFSIYLNLADAVALSYPRLSIQGLMNGKALTVADTADGDVNIAGGLTPGGGTLTVNDALLVDAAGGITMTNAADKLDVNGSFETRGLCDCRAGIVEIDGNFRQFGVITDSTFHDNAYVGLPAHVTKITGTNRSIHFDTPAASCFGQLDLSGATLTADSDMSLNCNLTADATFAYADLYFGGNLGGHKLTVNGNLYARQITLAGGQLALEGNFTAVTANCLVMTNTADSALVKGSFTSRYPMDAASMTAGVLEIRGNFSQLGDATAFRASGTHLTRLSGANKTVSFANPGASYFSRVELVTGTSFAAGSTLAMNCALGGDAAYIVPALYYSGNLAGHSLSVTGDLHLFGGVNPAGGALSATGAVILEAGATLTMANTADRLTCGGAFTGSGAATLTAGTVEFKKSFNYTGTSWAASGTHATVLSGGANMPVVFANPAGAWFSNLTVAPGTTFSSGSVLSLNATGGADMTLTVPQLCLRGTIGAHTWALTGSLTVPSGTGNTLTIGGGTLTVSGAMALDNLLVMTNAADRVTVSGSFTARGPDETGSLTNGKLYIKGNLTQLNAVSAKSYVCTGNHITVVMGTGAQTVTFASTSASDSRFYKLYSMNPDADFSGVQNFTSRYFSYEMTSASLTSLTGTGGGTLVPAFSPGTLNYIYVLPKGNTAATLTAGVAYQNISVNGTSSILSLDMPVSGVPYDGFVSQTVVVTALDGIAENTYTVKVEQRNADLQGIALSAGAGALTPVFDADTTSYTVTLPASVEKATLTPALDHADSTFTIGGQAAASREYALNPGGSVDIGIMVTSQDGLQHKTYTVTLAREKMLSGIDVSTGTFSFDSPTAAQSFNIAADQPSVMLTPHAEAGCTFTIDGAALSSKTYDLTIGGKATSTIVATAGSASFTYTITINRLPIISSFLPSMPAGATLTPAFNPAGGTFTLTIPAKTGILNVMPMKADCSGLTIDGAVKDNAIVELQPGSSRTLVIVARKNTVSASFTLTVTKSPIVTNLTPSQGTLTPAFSPSTTAYTVDVPATTEPVYVTPTLASGTATVNGAAWNPGSPVTVDPEPGQTSVLTVAATDGGSSITYTITVWRQRPVSGITLSAGTLSAAFNAREAEYTVSLPIATASVTVTPAATSECTALSINGAAVGSVTLTPGIGCEADAVIEAKGAGGVVSAYKVHVIRGALLAGIKLSKGSLSPEFNGGTLNYAVYLPNTTKSVRITPVKTANCASFKINGKKATNLVLSPKPGGASTATIVATGTASGLTQTIKVTVYRMSPVTDIKLSTGKLNKSFSTGRGDYTVSIPATKTSVTITPARSASCASLTIDGTAVSSKTLAPQIGCSVKAVIAATGVDGKVYTYTVTVSREAMLKGITVKGGTLSPAFDVTTLNYTVSVPATTSEVKLTPKKASTGVRSMTINGKKATSVALKPPVGGSASAVVVLTAKDGKTKQTYTVTVTRNPLITGIATSAGTITPAFNPAVTSYTVTLPADTAGATLSVTPATTGVQSVTMDGAAALTEAVTVPPCGAYTASIVAKASDGKALTYTVKVVRAPVIAGISVTGGTLSPAFSATTGAYTVSVPATVAGVTLTPVKAADCASMTIDGAAVSSKTYNPPVGGSVTATVTGTTALGLTRTYTVTITRAALVTKLRTSSTSAALNPVFAATTLNYTVDVPSTKSSLTIYASKAKKGVKSLLMNGKSKTSLTVKRNAAGVSVVTVVATASDKVTKVTYIITVNWK